MTHKSKVSISVSSFNLETYLRETIKTCPGTIGLKFIRAQTFFLNINNFVIGIISFPNCTVYVAKDFTLIYIYSF